VACKGGCWLQRKAGTQCFKEVWHVPGVLKTAAGIAICLGGLAGPDSGASAAPAESVVPGAAVTDPTMESPRIGVLQTWSLDEAINLWYFRQATTSSVYGTTPSASDPIWGEVAWKFFRDFTQDTLPRDISERCERVREALQTEERSLSLISLLWRAVNGPLFEADNGQEYSQEQRQAIRDTLAAIEQKSQEWRLEIFESNLDPYLSGGRLMPPTPGPVTKGGGYSYQHEVRYYLSKDLNEERWGAAADPETREAAQAYVQAHRYAEQMDLGFKIRAERGAGAFLDPNTWLDTSGVNAMNPFDVLTTTQGVSLTFEIKGDIRFCPSQTYGRNEGSLLDDKPGQQDVSSIVSAVLTIGGRYTYTELLNTVYEQNRSKLLAIAYDWLSANTIGMWDQNVPVVTAVYENGALLWPAIREIIESDSVLPTDGTSENATKAFTPAEIAEIHRRAVLKDIDFWML